MKTKVLFLDIDGVLATDNWYNSKRFEHKGITIPYHWDPVACNALNEIQKETKCVYVISSDWRLHYGLDELREIFWVHSLNGDSIMCFTDNLRGHRMSHLLEGNRSSEIQSLVERHRLTSWCAVDDMKLTCQKFVHIQDTSVGIANEEVKQQIIKYLND